MGLDLRISAERNAIVPIQGKMKQEHHFKQKISFDRWNLGSADVRAIMDLPADDRIGAYIDSIAKMDVVVDEEIFSEDDDLFETPIGMKRVNLSQEHIEKFRNWMQYCDENGFIVKFSAW